MPNPVIGYVVIEREGGHFIPSRDQYVTREGAEQQRDRWNVAACEAMSDITYTVAEVREIEEDGRA